MKHYRDFGIEFGFKDLDVGEEQFTYINEPYGEGVRCHYEYRYSDTYLFGCIRHTLTDCRRACVNWLDWWFKVESGAITRYM